MELFKINGLIFKSEDFQDEIEEFEDIIPIIQDLQGSLSYEEINCVGENDCCQKTDKNYFVEIYGFINEEDEFVTKEELIETGATQESLDLFVIRIYKCLNCEKWIIDIIE